MRVGVGIPSSRSVRAQFVKDLNDWLSSPVPGVEMVFPDWDLTAGRIDWSRSNLLLRARTGKEDVHVQLDTDVKPITSLAETIGFLLEDLDAGFDIVCAPTAAFNGQIMMRPKSGCRPTGRRRFEVEAAAFGFVAFGSRLIQEMKPVSHLWSVDGLCYPLFGEMSNGTTEDYSWCDGAREQGFHVAVDPRIIVSHVKELGVCVAFEDEPYTAPPACIVVTQRFDREYTEKRTDPSKRPEHLVGIPPETTPAESSTSA